jgi:hypothetical protein
MLAEVLAPFLGVRELWRLFLALTEQISRRQPDSYLNPGQMYIHNVPVLWAHLLHFGHAFQEE